MNSEGSIKLLDNKAESVSGEIYAIFQSSYTIEAELLGVNNFPPLKRKASNIQASETQFWGYFKSSQLAAVVELDLKDGLLDIHSFLVSPTYFRQSIGSKLLSHILAALSWQTAVVETAEANYPAILLYKKFGFVEEEKWLNEIGIIKVKFRKIST